jgi:hypothetical protein
MLTRDRWHRRCSSSPSTNAWTIGLLFTATASARAALPAAVLASGEAAPAVTRRADRGTAPEPGAIRPGSGQGNAGDETQGALVRQEKARRVLGLPVDAAIVITAVLVVLLVVAAFVVPCARRRRRAQGGGTYDPPA